MVNSKKGVSAIVATVLIIMISVAAVAILWQFIIPTVKESLEESTSEKVQLSIETSGGYTTWDEVQKIARVQIKRGNDNANLTGLDFNFVKQGNSKKNQTTEVPQPNQIKVYEFNLSDFGKPEKVTVAPITVSGVGAVSSESSAINEYGGSSDCIPNCEGKLCGDSNGCGDFCVVNPCSICRYINEETGLCFDWAWYNGVCQGLGSSASCVECIVDLDCPNNGLTNPNCATRSCKEDNTCTPEACGDPIETPYGADVGEACSLDEDCLPWLFCSPSNICAE